MIALIRAGFAKCHQTTQDNAICIEMHHKAVAGGSNPVGAGRYP